MLHQKLLNNYLPCETSKVADNGEYTGENFFLGGGGARNDGLLFEYLEFKDSSIPIHLKIGCFSYGTVSLSYFELPCVLCFWKFEVSLCNVQNIKL